MSGQKRDSRSTVYLSIGGIALLVFAILLARFYVEKAAHNGLSQVDGVLLQLALFGLSTGGSALLTFVFSRRQAQREARGAFRQVKAHYEGLQTIASRADELRTQLRRMASRDEHRRVSINDAEGSIQTVQWLVEQQIATAEVAVANWQALLPEESAKLEQQIAAGREIREQPRELTEEEVQSLRAESEAAESEKRSASNGA